MVVEEVPPVAATGSTAVVRVVVVEDVVTGSRLEQAVPTKRRAATLRERRRTVFMWLERVIGMLGSGLRGYFLRVVVVVVVSVVSVVRATGATTTGAGATAAVVVLVMTTLETVGTPLTVV